MIPLVNTKYKYIFYYNPKSACSTYRRLFLALHKNEISESKLKAVNGVHNIAKLWPKKPLLSYSKYYRFTIVRNPYSRVVSAYLDKCFEYKYGPEFRYKRPDSLESIHKPIFKFLNRTADFSKGYTFTELLYYLEAKIRKWNSKVDLHFQPQYNSKIKLDAFYRLEDNIEILKEIYSTIFIENTQLQEEVKVKIDSFSKMKHNPAIRNKKLAPSSGELLGNKYFNELQNVKRRKEKIDYSQFYNAETKKLVEKIFKEELFEYKYEFPYVLK